jgi:hypothetical protein
MLYLFSVFGFLLFQMSGNREVFYISFKRYRDMDHENGQKKCCLVFYFCPVRFRICMIPFLYFEKLERGFHAGVCGDPIFMRYQPVFIPSSIYVRYV